MVGLILSTLELFCWGDDGLATLQSPTRRWGTIKQHPGVLSAFLFHLWSLSVHSFRVRGGFLLLLQGCVVIPSCTMLGWAQGTLSMQECLCCRIPDDTGLPSTFNLPLDSIWKWEHGRNRVHGLSNSTP